MKKKEHPLHKGLYATEDGKIWYKNGNPISTNFNGTREKFAVKRDNKTLNFGLRRFIWECMSGEPLDKKWVVLGKNKSNAYKDLYIMSKSEQTSNIYKEIWRKKREQKNGTTK